MLPFQVFLVVSAVFYSTCAYPPKQSLFLMEICLFISFDDFGNYRVPNNVTCFKINKIDFLDLL